MPVAGQWVVLHRVGADRAAPLDSVRSGADGGYRFRYALSGRPDALYFVSSTYRGIAYFSAPLRAAVERGGDADLVVYDTTSDVASLRVQGRHLVVSAPRGSKREIAEIFEIENEGTRTVVPRDSTHPLWAAHFPPRAESLAVAPGDLTAGAVAFREGRADVFAPISPGVRQLVVTYLLDADAFPLTVPMERPISLLEVLLEEPRAMVDGARLTETSPAEIDGRSFRRFVANEVPASAVLRVSAPAPSGGGQNQTAMRVLAVVMALAMGAALVAWSSRRRQQRRFAPPPLAQPLAPSAVMIAELAALDAHFERNPDADYERSRAALKERIASALAAESGRV